MSNAYIDFPILDDIEKIILREAGSTVHYPKNHVVFSAGDLADRVFLIEDGLRYTVFLQMDAG